MLKFKKKKLYIILFLSVVLYMFFIWQNNALVITNYQYANAKVPKDFDGYRILQISDLHNKDYNGKLMEKVKDIKPDIIVITGDLIDRRKTRIDIAIDTVEPMTKLAPVYFVTGNHEQLSEKYEMLKEELIKLSVDIIDNKYTILKKGRSTIGLMGIADPAKQHSEETYLWGNSSGYMKSSLEELFKAVDTEFNILLSHRPEEFNVYKSIDIDLVFSGHAHGGQIRVPFIGGIVAPNQGLFPEYTEGIYREKATSMVVSRGLGNSILPLRIFNRPEVVVVTLKHQL
ncbi:metallophosphoesterase [Alkaliphilus pronyensis]|uniref:Metallophosphoesterase n=1 Tax=Alkaliphilus pronyensis TaxID=1482732 RepID=A0A6I0F1L7_9FIRM|nr:metallophosphoesterase [Alkaliphilus pronyensis]KAB3530302.1 metallophosphoesterase [Alkaliphilus pronyensis]